MASDSNSSIYISDLRRLDMKTNILYVKNNFLITLEAISYLFANTVMNLWQILCKKLHIYTYHLSPVALPTFKKSFKKKSKTTKDKTNLTTVTFR